MQILYLSLSYVPSRRASSVQVMNMCAALARRGHEVTLVAKRSREPVADGQADHAFYGVEPNFTVDKVARPPWRGGGLVYAAGVTGRVARWRGRADLVYCRDLAGALIASELGLPVVFEAHGLPEAAWQAHVWRRFASRSAFRGLVVISDALRRDVEAAGLSLRGPVVVAHDAAAVRSERAPASARRGGADGAPRVGYVGSLYPGRGVEIVVDLAARMPDVQFEVVGGTEVDLARWRAAGLPGNVRLHGFQPPARVAAFYDRLDVVLLPHPRQGVTGATGTQDISRWTSPMKMFEYMASGVPVIASDLAVLQEILRHDHNALIAPAGDVVAWEAAIRRLLGDADLRRRLATTARHDVEREHTWDARAARVLDGLGLERIRCR